MSAFIDEALIYAKAGDGGNGAVAWRREAHVAKGGPAGGDGGDGGDIVFVGDDSVHSLLDFKYTPRLIARDGGAGRGKNMAGPMGEDKLLPVPLGTQIFDADTDELLADITTLGQRAVLCAGGSGGFGNSRFATPSRQAPEFANPGLAGEEKNLRLSLKLMADVGLLGFPNAGKSTFLSRISAARPKIAAYPFTTLVPQLGVVRVPFTQKEDGKTFVVADIPGLIAGAAEGAGLGVQFLKHLERVRVLCHLVEVPLEAVDGTAAVVANDAVRGPVDLVKRYSVLRDELRRFSIDLAAVPEVVVVNKVDLLGPAPETNKAVVKLKKHLDKLGVPLLFMGGGVGLMQDDVVMALYRSVQAQKQAEKTAAQIAAATVFDPTKGIGYQR